MDIRAALNGQDDAATISVTPNKCYTTGIEVVAYSVSHDGNFVVGSMSKNAFNRFLLTGNEYDEEMVAAHARIGLYYDGLGGEARLMSGWTWEQHLMAK